MENSDDKTCHLVPVQRHCVAMSLCAQKVWLLVIAEKERNLFLLIFHSIPERNANDDCLVVDCLHKAAKATVSDKNLGNFK